jgi:hypothetical protein
MSYEDMTLSEAIEKMKAGWIAAKNEVVELRAEVARLKVELNVWDAVVTSAIEQLKEENRVFRLAQKSCEDCDGPTTQEHRELRAEVERLRSALIRLRDCDWVITPHDRMDAVRDIARHALEPLPVSDRVEIDHVPGVRKMVER